MTVPSNCDRVTDTLPHFDPLPDSVMVPENREHGGVGVHMNDTAYEEALRRICADAEAAPIGDMLGAGRIARKALRCERERSVLPADHPVALAQRLYDALNIEDVDHARRLLVTLAASLGMEITDDQ